MNSISAAAFWHRHILLLALLFITIVSLYVGGQQIILPVGEEEAETAVAVDNEATVLVVASDGMGDVVDLDGTMEDSTITKLTENSNVDNIMMTEGVLDDDAAEDDVRIEDEASNTVTNTNDVDSENCNSADSSKSTTESTNDNVESVENLGATDNTTEPKQELQAKATPVVQAGPYIDLLGDTLLSLEMVDEAHAQVHQHYTNEALSGKKVIGLYFSADWCGPCRQFTPDLVNFYNKMNSRRGKKDEFEIVWISRCRTVDAFGQYFTQMNWLALPPNEAMGQRGQYLGDKFKVKSIPTLVLLDEIGNVITTDARSKIPMDMAGIGFPWRSPISILVSTLVPRSFRLLAKSQISGVINLVKRVIVGKGNKLKEALMIGTKM